MRNGDGKPGSQLGTLIRAYRREAGLTQDELAARAGLSVAALRDIEQNRRLRPRPSSLAALTNALALTPEQAANLVSVGRDLAPPNVPGMPREPRGRWNPAGDCGW